MYKFTCQSIPNGCASNENYIKPMFSTKKAINPIENQCVNEKLIKPIEKPMFSIYKQIKPVENQIFQ